MGEARGMRFEGNTLVANRGYAGAGGAGASGAVVMRAVATFDGSYSSYTLNVMHGKENGDAIKRRGIDGIVREYLSITVTATNCSIQNGNGFAN